VVAPVFFLLVFGMIEIGRAVMVQQILTNASREGARVAVLDSATPTASVVKNKVVDYMKNGGISAATTDMVTINPSEPTTAAYGTAVTVTVQIPYSSVTWLPSTWFIAGSKKLTASTVMRRETVQ
jgi:Flp pilus assembly protein TadG